MSLFVLGNGHVSIGTLLGLIPSPEETKRTKTFGPPSYSNQQKDDILDEFFRDAKPPNKTQQHQLFSDLSTNPPPYEETNVPVLQVEKAVEEPKALPSPVEEGFTAKGGVEKEKQKVDQEPKQEEMMFSTTATAVQPSFFSLAQVPGTGLLSEAVMPVQPFTTVKFPPSHPYTPGKDQPVKDYSAFTAHLLEHENKKNSEATPAPPNAAPFQPHPQAKGPASKDPYAGLKDYFFNVMPNLAPPPPLKSPASHSTASQFNVVAQQPKPQVNSSVLVFGDPEKRNVGNQELQTLFRGDDHDDLVMYSSHVDQKKERISTAAALLVIAELTPGNWYALMVNEHRPDDNGIRINLIAGGKNGTETSFETAKREFFEETYEVVSRHSETFKMITENIRAVVYFGGGKIMIYISVIPYKQNDSRLAEITAMPKRFKEKLNNKLKPVPKEVEGESLHWFGLGIFEENGINLAATKFKRSTFVEKIATSKTLSNVLRELTNPKITVSKSEPSAPKQQAPLQPPPSQTKITPPSGTPQVPITAINITPPDPNDRFARSRAWTKYAADEQSTGKAAIDAIEKVREEAILFEQKYDSLEKKKLAMKTMGLAAQDSETENIAAFKMYYYKMLRTGHLFPILPDIININTPTPALPEGRLKPAPTDSLIEKNKEILLQRRGMILGKDLSLEDLHDPKSSTRTSIMRTRDELRSLLKQRNRSDEMIDFFDGL